MENDRYSLFPLARSSGPRSQNIFMSWMKPSSKREHRLYETAVFYMVSSPLNQILAAASPFAKMSEQQAKRIKSSGLGMLTTWSPQQFILNHPATGRFITHGGFNSITESLGSGIPLICWPFDADMLATAAHLTENINVAFELVQVRTGEGLKSMHRTGLAPQGVGIGIRQTIDLCRGEKGQEFRRNAEKFVRAWEEDGTARSVVFCSSILKL